MPSSCPTCDTEINRPKARYCGHCGEKLHAIQRVEARRVEDFGEPIIPAMDRQLAKQRLEVMTRMNAVMNDQRIKAMVMAIAARGGTGTVGVWTDD